MDVLFPRPSSSWITSSSLGILSLTLNISEVIFARVIANSI